MKVALSLLINAALGVVHAKYNVSSEQEQFLAHPGDIELLSLFYSPTTFANHTAALFKDIKVDIFKIFLKKRPRLISLLTAKDMAALSEQPVLCRMLAPRARRLSAAAISGMDHECIFKFFTERSIKPSDWLNRETVKSINDKVFSGIGSNAFLLFYEQIKYLGDSQIKAVLSVPNVASSIEIFWLYGMSAKQLALFSAVQLSQLSGWDKKVNPRLISRLPNNAFSKFDNNELHESVFTGMTKAHVEQFGNCALLRPELLNRAALSGLNASCYKKCLAGLDGGRAPVLGPFIALAADDLLGKLAAEEAALIDPADWSNFSDAQLKSLPEGACEGISKSANPKDNFIPSPKCFGALHPKLQAVILKKHSADLPAAILSHVTRDSVEHWPEKLGMLGALHLPGPMIQLLGDEIEKKEQHPCDIMTCEGCLNNQPYLMANMGISCAAIMKDKISKNADISVYRRLLTGAYMVSDGDDHKTVLETSHPATLKGLVTQSAYCKMMTHEGFKILSAALIPFPPACVRQMQFLEKLSADEIKTLGPRAFEQFDATAFGKLTMQFSITAVQFHNLGAAFNGASDQHPINGIPQGKVAAIPLSFVQEMTASMLAGMKVCHIRGLNEAQIKKIPPAAFRSLPLEQFSAMKIEALTVYQLNELGADLPGEAQYQLNKEQSRRVNSIEKPVAMNNKRIRLNDAMSIVPSWALVAATAIVALIV